MSNKTDIEAWLAVRKTEAANIDPSTAEVMWRYGQTMDPYGVDADLPDELQQVGREYFARRPRSDVWVSFHDLSDETREALWKKHSSKLAFPSGLLDFDLEFLDDFEKSGAA
jgi:hypothetical protein